MLASRFYSEVAQNYQCSMFLNKNVYERPKLFKLSLSIFFSKKQKNLFLLGVIFFLFFCNNVPFFKNIKGFNLRLLTKKLQYFLLQQDVSFKTLFYLLTFFISFGLANFSSNFLTRCKILLYHKKAVVFFNASSSFNFFFFFNLQQLLVKYPDINFFFRYSNLFLHFFFNISSSFFSKKELYLLLVILGQLKLPILI